MTLKLIKLRQVQEKVGNPSRASINRWEAAGQFPRRRQCGRNSVAWIESEIEAWIESRSYALGAVNGSKKKGA